MIGWLLGLGGKLKGWLAAAAIVMGAIGIAFMKGRAAGKQYLENEQHRRREQLQEKYDEIDRQPLDAAASYDRLRKLSSDDQ